MPQPNDGLVGLAPVEPRKLAEIMPNAQHQTFHGFMTGAPYQLAIVEFDDQGRCYDRGQMDAVAERLNSLAPEDRPAQGQDVILVVFVHGWKHDARSDDDNLSAFRVLLKETVQHEQATASPGAKARQVLGVFVGWRGLSEFGLGDAIADATFWGRQAAAQRVATGSPRELFGRLRHYRNRRRKQGGNPLLVIAGHSFGGMIVFSALAQSLIEAASAPAGKMVPQFADLVLLVNPAIEGSRYLPDSGSCGQPCLQEPGDKAASRLHLRSGRERSAGRDVVSRRQYWPQARRGDDRGSREGVRHPRDRLRADLPHAHAGRSAGKRSLRADAAGQRSGRSILGCGSDEGGDRRAWRHLAGPVPALHRQPALPACASFAAATGGGRRGAEGRDDKRTAGRSCDLRAIHRPNQTSAVGAVTVHQL